MLKAIVEPTFIRLISAVKRNEKTMATDMLVKGSVEGFPHRSDVEAEHLQDTYN